MEIINKIINKFKLVCKISILKVNYKKKLIIGNNLSFRSRFNVRIKNEGKIIIGNNVFFNNDCSLNSIQEIIIEDDCIFGENVKVYDHNHKFKNSKELIRSQGYTKGKVFIGKNCWIGSNVVILQGVKIGENSVIGAGNIIYKDIPKNSIVKNSQVQIISTIDS